MATNRQTCLTVNNGRIKLSDDGYFSPQKTCLTVNNARLNRAEKYKRKDFFKPP